jgi:hypothetical protein
LFSKKYHKENLDTILLIFVTAHTDVLAPWDLERNGESVYADRDANFPYMGGIAVRSSANNII